MSLPLTDEHIALAESVARFARDRNLLTEARACLDTKSAVIPSFFAELAAMGLLSLHLPTDVGGSGYGLLEAAIVAEQLGRVVAPGPFLPTVVVSAVLDRHADDATRRNLLADLASGAATAAFSLDAAVQVAGSVVRGGGIILAGPQARWIALAADNNAVVLVDTTDDSVTMTVEESVDPSRPVGRVLCDDAPAIVLTGARRTLTSVARLLFAAEAAGVAAACVDRAVSYAKIREQFGRPIGSFQAVKHHCTDMHVEAQLAVAGVWAATGALHEAAFDEAAAAAVAVAVPASKRNAELNIRVHGGIGFTWEDNAHLFLRRGLALAAFADTEQAAADVTQATLNGIRTDIPLEPAADGSAVAEPALAFLSQLRDQPPSQRLRRIVESGYAVPHWPPPWGRAAGAVERLAIQQAFATSGIERPAYGISGWILFAIVHHGTGGQIERWIRPGLLGEEVWCQLFSEPEAGSDAAAVRTGASRVEGGWRVSGHKLWTTQAHKARWGLATVRTDPIASKHAGLSTMAIDMHAPGVRVRPLRQINGDEEFNEVYLDEVFVPDDDVLGAVGDGWTVARATLAAESSSIGAGAGTIAVPVDTLLALWLDRPQRLAGGDVRIGSFLARQSAIAAMNVRATFRELAGHQPGAEAAVAKLAMTDNAHDGAELLIELAGTDGSLLSGVGAPTSGFALRVLALAIAGGTSEIKRNQIAERVLGLPREPTLR
jgi:alkylation response protein AidB-like acyl-CoA dehydrogenase